MCRIVILIPLNLEAPVTHSNPWAPGKPAVHWRTWQQRARTWRLWGTSAFLAKCWQPCERIVDTPSYNGMHAGMHIGSAFSFWDPDEHVFRMSCS